MNPQSHSRPKGKHRKQFFLFGISVLLPALVLLIFTLRMNRQDNELRIRRALEAQQEKAEEIGRQLALKLEKIEKSLLSELSSSPTLLTKSLHEFHDLIFVGPVINGTLLMPWESKEKQAVIVTGNQSDNLIREAQQAEFAQNDPARAKNLYNRALASATSAIQKDFIRLQLGRVLLISGEKGAAQKVLTEILAHSVDVTDEYGSPLCLYAADKLADIRGQEDTVIKRLEDIFEEELLLPPAALFLIKDVIEKIQKSPSPIDQKDRISNLDQKTDGRLTLTQEILSLKPSVQSWLPGSQAKPQTDELLSWRAFGDVPWIYAIRSATENKAKYLFVFHGPEAVNKLLQEGGLSDTFPGSCTVSSGLHKSGFSIGDQFREINLQFEETAVSVWTSSTLPLPVFYWLILFLVIGFTGFGMYLLWRDFRRELTLADMRSQFAASVSHELKTPLTSIRMFAEALTMGVQKNPEAQQDYLHTIINESERLSRLLNNVLDFSKIEQGTRTYNFDSISLDKVIQSAAKAIAFPMQQKGFNLQIRAENDIPDIRADKDALEQAVLNLLHNALKYSGDSRDIILKLQKKDQEIIIEVKDFGIGVSEEEKTQIFGRYFRGPASENQRIPGTGLGLTIVSHIARAHNGRVEVSSQPEKGSTFSIILPLEQK